MELLQLVTQNIRQGECMLSLDMKDAYLHVPVHQQCHKHLRFLIIEYHFQLVCLGMPGDVPKDIFKSSSPCHGQVA